MRATKKWCEHYWYTVPCIKARVEEMVRRTGKNAFVLEAGCNDGFLSQALIEAGNKVVSMDINEEQIKQAKEIFGIDAIRADVNHLPFKDESFDIVLGGELLEHLTDPGKGLSELFRVARGKVIISLPIGTYWLGEVTHIWEITGCSIDHDGGKVKALAKDLIVLEFVKRREISKIVGQNGNS